MKFKVQMRVKQNANKTQSESQPKTKCNFTANTLQN